MGLFDLPGIPNTRESDNSILKKTAKKVTKSVVKAGSSLLEKIANITTLVNQNLGEYKDKYICIRSYEELKEYIDKCISNGHCALDTETTGLNPMLDEIVGFSLYTKGQKAAYIPINHINYINNEKVDNQLAKEDCKEQLRRLDENNVKLIMFNAKFDIRVLRHQIGVYLTPWWDGYIAQKLLNENEMENGLKYLHRKYVLKNQKDAFSFTDLFDNITFNLIPIKTGYIYAARDAEVTYELFEYQSQFLDESSQKCIDKGLEKVAKLFRNIEMPLITVVADMEDTGITVDTNYMAELSEKYNKLLLEKEAEFYNICDKYSDKIEAYKKANPNHKLGSMINIASSTQIAILLYDILGEKPIPKQPARGTGEEILKAMNNEFCKAILDYREVAKLISTYVDKMQNVINPNDGKVHCVFNQYGAKTGRFSSQDPNMQNIPSHNKEIRKMFVAGEGNVLISSDFSQQEPRTLAHMCQDENMINAYKEGKDIYSWIASFVYNVPYEQCKEFNPDGSKNPEGKERRTSVKSLILGLMYGRGISSIAEQLNVSTRKAQEINDKFFTEFPKIKKFIDDSQEFARINGYVETAWGRKRRLPNIQLDPYEFDFSKRQQDNFNPLDFDMEETDYIDYAAIQKYTNLMDKAYGRQQKEMVKAKAREEGITIKDNGGFIADAERQCVNSIIQGTAADMTKKAMIMIGNDKQLKEWRCKLVLQVHDEVIAECPIKYAKQSAERLSELMIESAKEKISVPMKCDAEATKEWYGNVIDLEELSYGV